MSENRTLDELPVGTVIRTGQKDSAGKAMVAQKCRFHRGDVWLLVGWDIDLSEAEITEMGPWSILA